MAKVRMRKLTIMIPEDVLRRAQRRTKAGITPTIRKGLENLATQDFYARLLTMRGKGGFSMTWQELRGEE
jgi:hypothetical protein